MQVQNLEISDVKLITCKRFDDKRGFFTERFRQDFFTSIGFAQPFVQDNYSRSAPQVLRGLHYQYERPQGKLVTCVTGQIFDIAVDVRVQSPTFGKYAEALLSGTNPQWLWIPPGFAHGFCVTSTTPADVLYKVTEYYNASGEEGIHWQDPELKIDWPLPSPVVSARDNALPSFEKYKGEPRF